jgi:vacuole morphology and inheritance protein 14
MMRSQVLFRSWCHNPIAAFSLCLLAQSYSLSSALVTKLYPCSLLLMLHVSCTSLLT